MSDLKDPRLMWLKCALFLVLGMLAAACVWLENPTWKTAGLLALVAWAFCRAYYFAFYVIEHYIDPGYKFSGLGSFAAYLFKRRKS